MFLDTQHAVDVISRVFRFSIMRFTNAEGTHQCMLNHLHT